MTKPQQQRMEPPFDLKSLSMSAIDQMTTMSYTPNKLSDRMNHDDPRTPPGASSFASSSSPPFSSRSFMTPTKQTISTLSTPRTPSPRKLNTSSSASSSSSGRRIKKRWGDPVRSLAQKNNETTSPPYISTMDDPNDRVGLSSPDIFFDMNPRWRRAYLHDLKSAHELPHKVLLCPDDNSNSCTPMQVLNEEYTEEQKQQQQKLFRSSSHGETESNNNNNNCPLNKSPIKGKSLLSFGTSSLKAPSPMGVMDPMDDQTCVYFWHRSLAFSEDEDDDDDKGILQDHPADGYYSDEDDDDDDDDGTTNTDYDQRRFFDKDNSDNERRREFLSVPANLGKEFASKSFTQPTLSPSQKKTTSLRSLRNRLKQKVVRVGKHLDMDHVTPIHWEERIFNSQEILIRFNQQSARAG